MNEPDSWPEFLNELRLIIVITALKFTLWMIPRIPRCFAATKSIETSIKRIAEIPL